MAKTFLSINSTVPAVEDPGTPCIVFFDNGDWEIAFSGDTDYIEQTTSSYVGAVSAIEFLTDLRFELDFDEVDTDGTVAHLYVEGYTDTDTNDELVIMLHTDGETFVTERATAMHLLRDDDDAFNFIPVVDALEELRSFISTKQELMWENGEAPLDLGDEDEGEDG